MNLFHRYFLIIAISLIYGCKDTSAEVPAISNQEAGPLQAVLFNEVRLEDKFWKSRLKTQSETLVPFALDKTIPAVENLEKTAKFLKGDKNELPFPHRYIASDLYKVMEGAALSLMENPNPALEKRLDGIIEIIGQAQQEDGYLYEAHITGVSKDHDHWGGGGMGDKPYSFVLHSHELYNMGHMYEAAIAYYRATGKDKWLKIAEKNAKHINKVFFVGDPNYNDGKPVNQAPGHQELELALVKLYHSTGNTLYLEMAKKFLDIRGKTFVPDGEGVMSATYAQQHLPVAEQTTAVGHAVRAAYMYSAMADVGALNHTDEYNYALSSIWDNIVNTRMHITGGLGAVHGIEGFGAEYELPNKEAYNETCAAVGNVLFNHRLFLMHKDAKYMDVAEVSLFNNSLAGMNLNGNEFFYVNPLEADGKTTFNHGQAGRSPWFGTACCPSNLARLLPQVSGMMYAHTLDEIYVTLYAGNQTEISLKNGNVKLWQKTDYPFSGEIQLDVHPQKNQEFTLKLRIPTWTGSQFVPGALYSYTTSGNNDITLSVNGEKLPLHIDKGFATIKRIWKPGDKVNVNMPMEVKFNKSIPQVEANRDRYAVTKGPLVYCAEEIDNHKVAQALYFNGNTLSENPKISVFTTGIMKDIDQIAVKGAVMEQGKTSNQNITLVPYYSWSNRGNTSMIVWIPYAVANDD